MKTENRKTPIKTYKQHTNKLEETITTKTLIQDIQPTNRLRINIDQVPAGRFLFFMFFFCCVFLRVVLLLFVFIRVCSTVNAKA